MSNTDALNTANTQITENVDTSSMKVEKTHDSDPMKITNTSFALEMTQHLFEDLVAHGYKNIVKHEVYPGPIIDLQNLVRVMTKGTFIPIKMEDIKDLHDFVMDRLSEFDCSCLGHLCPKEYMIQIWKAGRIQSEFYYCYNYQLQDLSQIYPFVIEWILKRDDMPLNLDKESYEATALMMSKLLESLIKFGNEKIEFVKFYKLCGHIQCPCEKKPASYLDVKKLVGVLTDGGIIGFEGLTKLYVHLEKSIQEIDDRWSHWLPGRTRKPIYYKTFTKGRVTQLSIKCYSFYLQEIALIAYVVTQFILQEKPDLSYRA
ncbi:hypothetical protein [Acanthamoeba castellanii mimivirus]|uniref:Uncharacterized protein L859 n=5 Tax=Mimivirus TaxID=315393 RepID=YL859_MIMIV|nr:hypothetical protein MIMI_gp0920 [Acanthamoeba polyphaga mimivirus]Q5UQQ4.1 RecName: Full=Uncharacterized protein L859 [Acanthamoeba polyphaga mimivirus]AEQ61074.1 hypothetical protein [Acanthamoeba castellanii mamavirus]AHA44969.1 hypothetical protein HIRU_S63 [Hirudovirus strain Sangsue]AMK62073.1 hypothetical protein [Samba virus]AMZ03297.1 hypothetical protein [Mimivirus Bombay]EJN40478.1 hypothetical protein lvs_L753 [Acanthamoeba polyphaga lentillevirus]BAV61994.1 hypothetical prote